MMTQMGRVVYDRKKHMFGSKDVIRIVESDDTDFTEQELYDILDAVIRDIFKLYIQKTEEACMEILKAVTKLVIQWAIGKIL